MRMVASRVMMENQSLPFLWFLVHTNDDADVDADADADADKNN
jgi:hypothetical protein